jgi:predicted ATPase
LAVKKAGGADVQLYLGPKVTRKLEVKLRFGVNGYESTLEPTADNGLVFSEEKVHFTGGAYGPSEQLLGRGHSESKLKDLRDAPGATADRGIPYYVFESIESWTVYHFHDTSDSAAVRRKGTTRDYEKLRPDAANLAAFLLHLRERDTQRYELIRESIRLVVPFFDDFRLRPEELGKDTVVQLEWSQRGSDYPFHPSQLSDGTLRFICMATALLQPRPPATMLFDEPELGLHPYALSVLAGLLRQAATRTQVIVSTQSATLIDHFEPEDVVVVDREEGASTFHRLDSRALEEWLKQYSLGELWEKNVVEGGPVHE